MMTRDEWLKEVFAILTEEYHHRHPFQLMLQNGQLSRSQLQAWALNRYYYQSQIPIKDAVIISRLQDSHLRTVWRQRLVDQDGDDKQVGGVTRWLHLTTALGLEPHYVKQCVGLLPATRFAVDSYIRFVSHSSVLAAIASSLTEMSARDLIQVRMEGMLKHYDFIDAKTLSYFTERLKQNDGKSTVAMDYILRHAKTVEHVEEVLGAVRFKCQVLWAQLDALYSAYVDPGFIPPGAFDPLVQLNCAFQLQSGVILEADHGQAINRLQGPERSFELNDSALYLVKELNGKQTLSEIIDKLKNQYPQQENRIQQDVLSLCQILLEKGFIEA